MAWIMRCKDCGYESTGGDDITGQNIKDTLQRFPDIIDCELCGGVPEVLFYLDEDYNALRKRLNVPEDVIIFVKKVSTKQ